MAASSQTIFNSSLETEAIHQLFYSTVLKELYLCCDTLRAEDLQLLVLNTTITKLSLPCCKLPAAAGKYLAEMRNLKDLDVSFNDLGDEGAKSLALSTSITKLNIAANDLYHGLAYLAACTSLTSLDIFHEHDGRGDRISDKALKAMGVNTTLKRLLIEGYPDFTSKFLELNTGVTELFIDEEVGDKVANALVKNTCITKLYIDEIYEPGLKILVNQPSVTDLHFRVLEICDETAAALTLATNTRLISLKVDETLVAMPDALLALAQSDALLKVNGITQCVSEKEEKAVRKRVKQNLRRVKEVSHACVVAIELMFKLKANILRRVRWQ